MTGSDQDTGENTSPAASTLEARGRALDPGNLKAASLPPAGAPPTTAAGAAAAAPPSPCRRSSVPKPPSPPS